MSTGGAGTGGNAAADVRLLTGTVTEVRVERDTPDALHALGTGRPQGDISLKRMAEWAMNYLIRTPRPHLNWEPVFQCHPLRCPPVPEGPDVVVPCDTDARMEWEWYFMRDVCGSTAGRDVEAAFHRRMRGFLEPDGTVLAPPGCYNEGDIHARFEKKDYAIHMWGATKILKSLSEDFLRTRDTGSRDAAQRVMRRLSGLTSRDTRDGAKVAWFPGGMAAIKQDGSLLETGWSIHPAPIVEPLLTYWQATGDGAGLEFAREYAEGILHGAQEGGIRFRPDGRFDEPLGHSHATMHNLWGVAHLGVLTGEARYVDFVRRAWDWMLSRGTGTGWFPAMPDSCNETCCVSDMMSNAALIGQAGHPEYYDCVERYLRNYISPLQFIVTLQFEAYYRKLNAAAGEEALAKGLEELRRFQGGIIGGSGLNDYENDLLGRVSSFEMFGCCAPEGMRAIHTAWSHTIDRRGKSPWGPAGVYVNLCLSRESPWGETVSFFPDQGRLTVKAAVEDRFFLRPPHWVARDRVRAYRNARAEQPRWEGAYVSFEAKPGDELTVAYPVPGFTHRVEGLWPQTRPDLSMGFRWLGNMVVEADPPAEHTPLFTGSPRRLPPAPAL